MSTQALVRLNTAEREAIAELYEVAMAAFMHAEAGKVPGGQMRLDTLNAILKARRALEPVVGPDPACRSDLVTLAACRQAA